MQKIFYSNSKNEVYKMKKWIFVILVILAIGVGLYFFQRNTNREVAPSSNYSAQKLSAHPNETIENNTTEGQNTLKDQQGQENSHSEAPKESKKKTTTDTNNGKKLAKFSTRLPHDTKARYSNIDLACDTLSGTVVKSGDTFSLWDTLGCPTKQKGYRLAKAFTSDGKVKKSYGGGICQVSTTIYNALLKVKGLKIIERHEHSRDVVYIQDGKDAAVSYKTADLKFKNTLDYDVKLLAAVKNNRVVITIKKV